MAPKVSFVVPVWNVGAYLEDCLDSLLNQTFTDYEIVIVYDVSQDNTLQVCKQYADNPRVRLIIREINEGNLVGARNTGIKQASGLYTCLIDGDDIVHEDLLKITYNIAANNDAEVVFFDAKMFYGKTEKQNLKFDYSNGKSEFALRHLEHNEILRGYHYGILSGNSFQSLRRRSIYEDYDVYYYNNQACESTFQAIPMAARIKSAYYLPIDLYCVRVDRPGSIRHGLDYSTKVLRDFTNTYLYRLHKLDSLSDEILTAQEKCQCGFKLMQVMIERYLRYQKEALYSIILEEKSEMLRNLVFFGVSAFGIELTNLFKFAGLKMFFCDNDRKRQGQMVNGVRVISPEELRGLSKKSDYRLFIASRCILEIAVQLLENKVIASVNEVMPFMGQTERERCFVDLFEQYMSLRFSKAKKFSAGGR
ncbi:MAG: glycosyltransferase [Acidaminococcales bacterium]|nr:glycosyltransferase [Acidaminococcales bacterium]